MKEYIAYHVALFSGVFCARAISITAMRKYWKIVQFEPVFLWMQWFLAAAIVVYFW